MPHVIDRACALWIMNARVPRAFIIHKALHTMLHLLHILFTNMIGLLAKSATVATRFGLFSLHQIGLLAVTKVASARYPGLATRFNAASTSHLISVFRKLQGFLTDI